MTFSLRIKSQIKNQVSNCRLLRADGFFYPIKYSIKKIPTNFIEYKNKGC